jgi:hypothetical protein
MTGIHFPCISLGALPGVVLCRSRAVPERRGSLSERDHRDWVCLRASCPAVAAYVADTSFTDIPVAEEPLRHSGTGAGCCSGQSYAGRGQSNDASGPNVHTLLPGCWRATGSFSTGRAIRFAKVLMAWISTGLLLFLSVPVVL